MTPDALVQALAQRRVVDMPVAVVVAHPDDEAIGIGGSLHLLPRLLLLHVTDGAPRGGTDAAAFGGVAAYAATRRRELEAALRAAGVAPERLELEAADQGAAVDLAGLARRLGAALRQHGARAVLTHPYEGGHPDHDSTAFLVHAAGVPAVEMASYHAAPDGGWRVGCFLDGPGTVVALSEAEQATKRAMFAAHASQRGVLDGFGTAQEAFRPAPPADFTRPPHPGQLLYERYDWGMTGARWRALAAAATRELGACGG